MKRNPDLGAAIDERLEKAIERANYQITLGTQKRNSRLKLELELKFATNGGLFQVSPELISFVQTLINRGHDDAILIDVNHNPIFIENLEDFQEKIIEQYYQALNEFLAEHRRIQKSRKPEALVS